MSTKPRTKHLIDFVILLSLAVGRVILLSSVKYHEAIEEYGIHWNFFFTLAFISLVGTLTTIILPDTFKYGIFGLVLLIIHQFGLMFGLTDYVRALSNNQNGLD
eukprot:NODE_5192_length_1052_cov_37.107643_g4633_i0.p1 GENE.NODE_5192_length_1052_cov_37.107643_g4633_i0~~NODE_5192_length_1052_cov_37.107643_g4633_i0.p1  ORF type:complete len:104 (+),score=4.56 NODE_5192_length_1052_cov_37.107643_g4633_i0:93-404(+)